MLKANLINFLLRKHKEEMGKIPPFIVPSAQNTAEISRISGYLSCINDILKFIVDHEGTKL